MSHTKGPWKIEGREKVAIYVGNGNDTVAGIFDTNGKDGEANARLIAAAPELLKACKAAFSAWGEDGKDSAKAFELLQAAIAKAEGA